MSRPFVSCLCPTYNRRHFLPNLLYLFTQQTYPKELSELVILDDSTQSNQDLIDAYVKNHPDHQIRYQWLSQHIPLGHKRNLLNQMAKGDYIVCFDDDDYYPPERISHAIMRLQATKQLIAGSTILIVYFVELGEVYQFGPYGPNHATNGTLAYHRDYLRNHHYEDHATSREESIFLDYYRHLIVQLDPSKTIICLDHGHNTFDKTKLIPKYGVKIETPIKKLIRDPVVRQFIMCLRSLNRKASNDTNIIFQTNNS